MRLATIRLARLLEKLLLIPQSLDRVEHGGVVGGVNAEDDSRHHGEPGRSHGLSEEGRGAARSRPRVGAMYHVAVPGSGRIEFG
jgi:hypothetical protein